MRSALITGSTSGIGYGIATRLAEQGYQIVFNGLGDSRTIDNLQQHYSQKSGQPAIYWDADLTRQPDFKNLPAIDVLINNAGMQHTAPVEEFPAEKWETILALNLSAAFYTTQALLPGMRERGWGRIINIASVHGLVASVNKSAYVAAKHGLIGLTKVVALENAQTSVTCNAICPGWVLTPLVQQQIDRRAAEQNIPESQARAELLGEKQPSQRFTTPEQLGDLVLFLCSDAAANITGANLPVDGGWTAQ